MKGNLKTDAKDVEMWYAKAEMFQYDLSTQFADIAVIPAQSDGGVHVGRRQFLLDRSLQELLVSHAAECFLPAQNPPRPNGF